MATFNIQPVEYLGKRLTELGDRISAGFYPLFTDYQINNQIRVSDLDPRILFGSKDDPSGLWIHGHGLIRFLSGLGLEPIIGITSLNSTNSSRRRFERGEEDRIYGLADSNGTKVVYVSAPLPEFDVLDSDAHVEMISIVARHEMGHAFGLVHHDNILSKKRGLCLMNREGYEGLVEGKNIRFCKDCKKKLGIN